MTLKYKLYNDTLDQTVSNTTKCTFGLTDITSNVLKLWLVSNELLLCWNIDAHVARKPDGWRRHPDMDLSQRTFRLIVMSAESASHLPLC